MTLAALILREIRYRWMNFIFGLAAVITVVALMIAFFTAGKASNRETIRIMRDLGYNIRIIPGQTNMDTFWSEGYSDQTMPETFVLRLAEHKDLSYAHMTAVLQKKIQWQGRNVILLGMAPELDKPGENRTPMSYLIHRNRVIVGHAVAVQSGLLPGDRIAILNQSFIVEQTLSETGSMDDIRIYANLHDVQGLLNLPDRINEIRALQCLCSGMKTTDDPLALLRKQLANVLPEARIIFMRSVATARQRQRSMVEKYFGFIMPFIILICMVWIGLLAWMNVMERREEMGVMRALGYTSDRIFWLFFGKALVMGIIGAPLGYGFGTAIALVAGHHIFSITAGMIRPEWNMLLMAVGLVPLLMGLSTLIPAFLAVSQDPAEILREV